MATSAKQEFTIASDAGGSGWINESNLLYPESGAAYADYYYVGPGYAIPDLYLSVPNYITSIVDGAEFVSLEVELKAYGRYASTLRVTLGSGGEKQETLNTSYTTHTFSGDASYWGLSGTAKEIFTALKNGSTKLKIDSYSSADRISVKEVYTTLTYSAPDTKRASLLIPVA